MTVYPTPDPIRARVEIGWGDVHVVAAPVAESLVEVTPSDPADEKDRRTAESIRVTFADGRLDVVDPRRHALIGPTRRTGSVQVALTVPEGSAVELRTALGLLVVDGRVAEAAARTSAGDVRVAQAGLADLRTGIGAVAVGQVTGDLRITTGSGAVDVDRVDGQALVKNSNGATRIGTAGTSTRVKGANGDIDIERARGDVMATTANGNVHLGSAACGSVMLRTSMGGIELGIPHGTAAKLALRTSFGAVRNGLEAADGPHDGDRTVEVDAQTSAGDIDVVRALPEVA